MRYLDIVRIDNIVRASQTFWTNLVLRRGAELTADELGAIYAEHTDVDEKDEVNIHFRARLSVSFSPILGGKQRPVMGRQAWL